MISIIVPVYKEAKLLDKFLTSMTKQTSGNYRLVLTVDTNSDNVLSVIEKHKSLKKKIDFIYNTKRVGKAAAIKNAIKGLTTEYSLVISSSVIISTTFIKKLNDLIKRGDSDIIEFNARLKSPFKMKGKVRKIVEKKIKISDDPSIIAYSYPLEFNKIVRTSVLQKTNKIKMSTVINSMFGAEHIYKTLFHAETYTAFNEDILTKTKSTDISKINLSKIIDQWKYIKKYVEYNYDDEYKYEIEYAHFYHINVFIAYLASKIESKVVKKKIFNKLSEINKTYLPTFFETNKYLLSDIPEAKILKKNKNPEKHSRNLKDIQAWT